MTADPGYTVDLYHFDLGGWPGSDYVIQSVSVQSLTSTLFSQTDVLVEGDLSGPRHTAFDFATPLSADQLLIQIDFSNLPVGIQDNVGLDNIRFGQTPPPSSVAAPGGLALLCSGLLALVGLGKRKRT